MFPVSRIWFFLSAALVVTVASPLIPALARTGPVYLEGSIVTRVEDVTEQGAGPHTVEVAEGLLLFDRARGKNIGAEICYPKTMGVFPLIIFSHGSIASGRDYRLFGAYWASHGYVCVLPTHDDAVTLHMGADEKVSLFKLARLAEVNSSKIEERKKDISLVIDSLPMLPQKLPALAGKIDINNIAIAGHHAGAYAAEALAGAAIGATNKEKQSDDRIKAVVAITGKDWRQPDLSKDDLDSVELPMMLISFSIDGKSLAPSRERIFKAMENAPSGNKYVVTADVTDVVEKPTVGAIRKAVKSSNVELISFHPVRGVKRLLGKQKDDRAALAPAENVRVGQVADSEKVGGSVLQALGLGGLLPEKSNRSGLNFLMSFTLPFLDGYLKNDKAALERLGAEDQRSFGGAINAKVERY